MSRWRHEAFERLPGLRKQLQREKTLFGFCHALYDELVHAYERKDEALIRDIYLFSTWCLEQPESSRAEDDLPTAISLCFFEHLPEREQIRRDLSRRLPHSLLVSMKEIFCYHGTPEQFQEIIQK
jgi:hypothetical protein